MQKIIVSIISFLLCISIVNAAEVNLNSKRYIMYNLNDNKVIYSKKEHERTSIASLTKIMTAIISIENEKNLDKKVTITSDMVDGIPWDVMKYGFKNGERVTYRDLLYATMLPSAADAVYALEISISGSEKSFVKLMNQKVKELGLKDTKFANGVGLYDKNNYSSAYDMAQILEYGLKNATFKKIFTTRNYKMSNGQTLTSTLLRFSEKSNEDISFIKGSKTGHIDESGYCLASIANLKNINYLLVTLNAPGQIDHIKDHVKAYNYFAKNYGYKEIVNENDKLFTLETKYAKEKYIDIYPTKSVEAYLKNDFKKENLVFEYNGIKNQTYFDNNKYLGHFVIKYNDEVLDEFDIYNNQAIHFDIIEYLKEFKNIIIYIFVFFIVIIIVLIVTIKKVVHL